MPAEHLAGLSYRNREARWEQILTADRPAESNFVAETVAGDVVGFAGGGPEREGNPTYRGELYGMYLLEAYQRKGLGRRLVSAVAHRLLADRFGSMLVWVLKDNHPACRFYESLGGERVGRKTIAIGWGRPCKHVLRLERRCPLGSRVCGPTLNPSTSFKPGKC